MLCMCYFHSEGDEYCDHRPVLTYQSYLEIGIMAGCTISPLVIIRASKRVVCGDRLKDETLLPPIQAYIDNMTTLTITAPCTCQLFPKLKDNLKQDEKDESET